MNIAFNINKLGMEGLGPSMTSLIRNCSDADKLIIWILSADLDNDDKQNIKELLDREGFNGKINFHDFDPIANFGHFRSLHGDWTTYGRLLLPEILLDEKEVLYLDADIIVELDVLKLKDNFDFKGYGLAVVKGGEKKYSLENKFYIDVIGLNSNDISFNAGILYFNLDVWRNCQLKKQCMDFGRKYSEYLLSADQTILNVIFNNQVSFLPDSFNCAWPANKDKPKVSENMILHFVGSPKPWDFLGQYLHKGYREWGKYSTREWRKKYGSLTINKIKRTWEIRRSLLRSIITN